MFRSIARTTLTRPALAATRPIASRFISVGAKIPSIQLFDGSPGNAVEISEELAKGKNLLIGVPGAFSPACSASHVPGYIKNVDKLNAKGIDHIIVIAVNDAFVTKAWGDSLLNGREDGKVKFYADPKGDFTDAIDLLFDASKFFGNKRSVRYALLVEDGVVKKTFVEPDNVSVDVSAADKVSEQI